MMEFDPFSINSYTVDELKEFLNNGISFADLQNSGLKYDMQATIREWLNEKDRKKREDDEFWQMVKQKNTRDSYQLYLETWESQNGQHVSEAKFELALLDKQRREMLEELFQDLKENAWRYRQDDMKLLFNGNPSDAQRAYLKKSEGIMARFVLSGMKLNYKELVENKIIPNSIKQTDLIAPDYSLPPTQIKDMGIFPKDRTDVYFLGVPRSGKSSVLSGIMYKLWKDGRAGYEPQIVDGKDPSWQYYQGLIRAIASKKPPQGTPTDTISLMKVNIRDRDGHKENPITIVEISGEAFNQLSKKMEFGCDMWAELGATQCITNSNKKLLFFVLDYSVISDKNPQAQCTEMDQVLTLAAALNVLRTDGPDKDNPEKNCTLSKVDSVAIIMTKSDLMEATDQEGRLDEAEAYINARFKNFMNDLLDCCRKWGINRKNDYNPYILAFSLGKFYIGNTVVFNDEDSEEIIEFISSVTRGKRVSGWGRIFG